MIEYVLVLGITMLSCAITVYLRDMEQILGVISMAWMYMAPIIYSVDIVPEELKKIYYLNPITPIIVAFRDILYYKRVPQISTLTSAIILGVIVMILGVFSFKKMKRRFAEEL